MPDPAVIGGAADIVITLSLISVAMGTAVVWLMERIIKGRK